MSAFVKLTESNVAILARKACRTAERDRDSGREFCLSALPKKEQAAADALIYAALSWHFSALADGKPAPKTMQWLGVRWYLAEVEGGRLQVSVERGRFGLVSLPALYQTGLYEVVI